MHNPTAGWRSARIRKKDRPVIDPFRIEEAETLIAAIHRDWGEAQGNYGDLNLVHGTVRISNARVAGVDKDTTKTGDDRLITLCAHALKIAKRQLLLRAKLRVAGRIGGCGGGGRNRSRGDKTRRRWNV